MSPIRELTYRYKLEPTPEQARAIRRHIGAVRFVYNKLLEDITETYRKDRTWKKVDVSPLMESVAFLKELDPGAIIWAEKHLQKAFGFFFHALNDPKVSSSAYRPEAVAMKRKNPSYVLMDTDLAHYPRQKPKKTGGSYATTFTDIRIENGRVFLPAVGNVKIRYHRPLPEDAEIHYCTVVQKPTGKIYLLIHLALPEIRERDNPMEKTLGAVFTSDERILVRSDEVWTHYEHQSDRLSQQIAKAEQTLRRRKKGSAGYEEARLRLVKLYEKRTNQRQDQMHKISRTIADEVDILYLRPPSVQKELKAAKRSRRPRILDQSQYELFKMLSYKTEYAGKRFWATPADWPAYEICSACGKRGKSLEEDSWLCPYCNTLLPAHYNAALNMEALAEKYKKDTQQMKEMKNDR